MHAPTLNDTHTTQIHTYTLTSIRTHTQAHTCTYTHMHTCTHAHPHTHTPPSPQVQDPIFGGWDGSQRSLDGVTSGSPLMLYEYTRNTLNVLDTRNTRNVRTLAMAPTDNFFISGQATVTVSAKSATTHTLGCGIRTSVKTLPKGFQHSTVGMDM